MNATVKAHGLDGGLVTPDWAPLTLAELGPLLEQFPALGAPVEILFASPRPLSAAGLVATTNGRVFVKRHHRAVRDREGLLEEHRFLAHLFGAGAPVPRLLKNARGETAIEVGDWTYEVHEPAKGVDVYEEAISWTPFRRDGTRPCGGAGFGASAWFAEGYRCAASQECGRWWRASRFSRRVMRRRRWRVTLRRGRRLPIMTGFARARCTALELLAPFHAELRRRILPALEPLWTHNDLHASNLFSATGRPGAGNGDHRLRSHRPDQRRPRSGACDRAQYRRVAGAGREPIAARGCGDPFRSSARAARRVRIGAAAFARRKPRRWRR